MACLGGRTVLNLSDHVLFGTQNLGLRGTLVLLHAVEEPLKVIDGPRVKQTLLEGRLSLPNLKSEALHYRRQQTPMLHDELLLLSRRLRHEEDYFF